MRLPINTKLGFPFGAKPYFKVYNPDGTVFGWKHHGQDFPAKVGTPVYAPQAGRVTLAGKNGTAGIEVRILRTGNTQSRLLHLSQVKVKVGQTVKEGQLVGLSGNTGLTTGPHLHWSVSAKGKYVNPLSYVADV